MVAEQIQWGSALQRTPRSRGEVLRALPETLNLRREPETGDGAPGRRSAEVAHCPTCSDLARLIGHSGARARLFAKCSGNESTNVLWVRGLLMPSGSGSPL